MVQQTRSLQVFTRYDFLRIDLLQTIRDRIAIEPHVNSANSASAWVEKAIAAASSDQPDWIVKFFLSYALGALSGKRYEMDIRGEIECAILEFQ